MMIELEKIQRLLKEYAMDGWIFTDFHGRDEITKSFLSLSERPATRRLFYIIYPYGEPVKILSAIEPLLLDHLPGERRLYMGKEALKDELKNQKQIDLEVILDFTYLPVMVEGEEEGERPKNPLLFMAYDNTDGGVITMDILEEGDDEISRTLGFFISFVQQNGRMKTIKARNPWIFGALEDICEYCSVDLVYDPVEIMDQVIEEVVSQL
jgi:hypothetical protein